MASGPLKEFLAQARHTKQVLKGNKTMTEENAQAKLLGLMKTSEELGAARERIRILNELTANGSKGDHFEIKYDLMLKIVAGDK